MQKVVFSVTKVNSEERQKGVGYMVEGNLLIPAKSSKGNTYIEYLKMLRSIANSKQTARTNIKVM